MIVTVIYLSKKKVGFVIIKNGRVLHFGDKVQNMHRRKRKPDSARMEFLDCAWAKLNSAHLTKFDDDEACVDVRHREISLLRFRKTVSSWKSILVGITVTCELCNWYRIAS